MKIQDCEMLHCDAGWRNFSFLKLRTSSGVIGISEYNESYGSQGLSTVIAALVDMIKGDDPLLNERISQKLYAITRQAPGGVNQQAIAAIENALLDIKGKALGVPVHQLLGGAIRDELPLYWSHCGTYRMAEETAKIMGVPALKSLDDVAALGEHVKKQHFKALKTNIFRFGEMPSVYFPGFGRGTGWPALNANKQLIVDLRKQIQAFQAGAGDTVDILLDLNFNFKPEGLLAVCRQLDDLGLFWYEMDLYDAPALRHIRNSVQTPIASGESLFGLRGFRPFVDHYAMDVAIIDVPWNGIWTALKMAALCESFEINCAPHNFYGHLSTLMSAHFCAAIPNFRVMEIDIDDVPWKDELVTHSPLIKDGSLQVPSLPGWGTELNEAAIAAHPPK